MWVITSSSPNSLLSYLKYGAYIHLYKDLSWVGLGKGKTSRTMPGDPTWTQEMPQDGGGRNHPKSNWKLASYRPERLRIGKAYCKQPRAY